MSETKRSPGGAFRVRALVIKLRNCLGLRLRSRPITAPMPSGYSGSGTCNTSQAIPKRLQFPPEVPCDTAQTRPVTWHWTTRSCQSLVKRAKWAVSRRATHFSKAFTAVPLTLNCTGGMLANLDAFLKPPSRRQPFRSSVDGMSKGENATIRTSTSRDALPRRPQALAERREAANRASEPSDFRALRISNGDSAALFNRQFHAGASNRATSDQELSRLKS
eukprot:scaffold492_cov257-Pinguiococcus_pyrenoidosus.AAC.19